MITVDEALDRDMALTDEEYFKVHGTLNVARIEGLLRMAVCADGSEAVRSKIKDASASFSDEDFLEPVVNMLRKFWNQIPVSYRMDLSHIISELRDVQTATQQSSEYGREQLESAESLLYTP